MLPENNTIMWASITGFGSSLVPEVKINMNGW